MRTGGRTPTFTRADLVATGKRLGLAALSVQAVADALGVTTAAVYRHVPSRSALERLIGEAILAELDLGDLHGGTVADHLTGFALRLREFTLAHPGTAAYLQRLFPRGASGVRLLESQISALSRHGYRPEAAVALCSAMATLAIGAAVAEQQHATGHHDAAAVDAATTAMRASTAVRQAAEAIPAHTPKDYFMFMMTAAADGLVRQLPPGEPITIPGRER